jgi:hypothetical protein
MKKIVIEKIHRDDAYYVDRKVLIGQRVRKSSLKLEKSPKRGYVSGNVSLIHPVSGSLMLLDDLYFLGVKLKEIEEE